MQVDTSSKGSSQDVRIANRRCCDWRLCVVILLAIAITCAGCAIVLLNAFEKTNYYVIEGFFMLLYCLAFLGLLAMFLLHAGGRLTSNSLLCDKKSGFNRVGMLILGSGGLIYQVINLYEMSFSIVRMDEECRRNYVGLIKTALAVLVTVMQVLFLVKFAVVRVNYSAQVSALSRLIMCHMIATNLCVWFRTIVTESMHMIHSVSHEGEGEGHLDSDLEHHGVDNATHPTHSPVSTATLHQNLSLTSHNCDPINEIGELFSPYTYPLLIEFSILVIGLYVNVIEGSLVQQESAADTQHSHGNGHQHSQHVHHNTFEGLIMGWLSILIAFIFVLLMLYGSYSHSTDTALHGSGIYAFNLTLVVIALVAGCLVIWRMSAMDNVASYLSQKEKRENGLLMTTFLCMVCYKLCCFIAGIHESNPTLAADGCISIISGSLTTYLIIIHVPRRRLQSSEQRTIKPGRQGLEILRCTNLAIWLVNTFLLKSEMAVGPLTGTFGNTVWPILANTVQPMTILFYFHGIMCLSHIIAHAHTWHGSPHAQDTDVSKPYVELRNNNGRLHNQESNGDVYL